MSLNSGLNPNVVL